MSQTETYAKPEDRVGHDYVLIKDIVIPAGTRFRQAPIKTERSGDAYFQATLGLSKDTHGDFTYCIGEPNSVEFSQLKDYFRILQ